MLGQCAGVTPAKKPRRGSNRLGSGCRPEFLQMVANCAVPLKDVEREKGRCVDEVLLLDRRGPPAGTRSMSVVTSAATTAAAAFGSHTPVRKLQPGERPL
eukprot:Rhum_TRINITY_DN17523_c0_g1::Rhum_TRINITY_DN17523_c0_g1_i1::g.166135::m.166135